MKLPLILSASLLLCVCSCKKEAATPESVTPIQVSSIDYRDSVTGNYYGVQIECSRFGYPVVVATYDTTICTLQVIKDTANPDQIIIAGLPWHFTQIPEKIFPNDSTLHRVQSELMIDWGYFSTATPSELTFSYGHQGMTGGLSYSYQLVKQ